MKISSPAIPSGSTVVVIGANGYIALETCEKLLEAGFRVRGTVRDVERHRTWMHALFDVKWPTMFELVQVPNFQAEGAFDAAFQGLYRPTMHNPNASLLTCLAHHRCCRSHLCLHTRHVRLRPRKNSHRHGQWHDQYSRSGCASKREALRSGWEFQGSCKHHLQHTLYSQYQHVQLRRDLEEY